MIEALKDWAVPVAVSATVGLGAMFGVDHEGRISSLETDNHRNIDQTEQLLNKVDELTIVVNRIDAKLEERDGKR